MFTLTTDELSYMESAVKEQVQMICEAMAESARFGKCPVDLRGSLLMLCNWLRSEKRDFIEWAQVTNYAHGEWLTWFSWIQQEATLPRADLGGLTGVQFYELFVEAGNTVKIKTADVA